MTAPLPLSQISLRHKERGLLLGGTEAGKSTMADYLGRDFVRRYAKRKARRLILDSKPRYRAEWKMSGRSADRLYRHWDHGPVVANSVVCYAPEDLERAFAIASTVIVQGDSSSDIPRIAACARKFYDGSRAGRPQLLQVDEVLDFYHPNSAPRVADDPITKSVRAGREKGTACLICSQRTKGIPTQILEELTKCYLFRIDARQDAKRLQEMGAPLTMVPPRRMHEFVYWTKKDYERVYGPYMLDLRVA